MESTESMPYEPPTIVTYGTVQELTLGSGGTNTADAMPCTGFQAALGTPSGLICKGSKT